MDRTLASKEFEENAIAPEARLGAGHIEEMMR